MIYRHYIELLQRYRWNVVFVLIFSTVAFGLAGYYRVTTSPQYTTAASVLLVPSEAEREFGLDGTSTRTGIQTMSETYMEYVKSRPIVETAIARIDAAKEAAAQEAAVMGG